MCICGAVANYECLKCTEKSKGKALVYCDNCKPMADQVHFQLHHSAELEPLPQSTYYMDLVAVMCVKEGRYSAFVKAGGQRSSPWYYYDPSEVGNPKVRASVFNRFALLSCNNTISFCFRSHWNSICTCGLIDSRELQENITKRWSIHC